MLSLFTLLFIISAFLLIIGIIKPKWAIIWLTEEQRNRKRVIKYFGLSSLSLMLILLNLLFSWIMFYIVIVVILMIFALISLLIGLVKPSNIVIVGKRSRGRILLQYGVIIFVLFIFLISVANIIMANEEVDERIIFGEYQGDRKDGQRQGLGKLGNNSTSYEGEWQNDKRNGKGIEYTDFGFIKMKYNGEWKNNQENGQGKMTMKVLWMDMVYEGEWKDGKREGKGKYMDRGGNIYEGNWVNDAPKGTGKFTLTNGETYEGELNDWKRNGFGKAISGSGEVLEGNWFNDELEDSDSNRKEE
ncbi:MORN repeat-containing protein [Rossellomorea vietnamensis]|uniref:MORN repeat-containing protein n=1 Tax=Rossellomorea vietnamensis TaxID=218284 RepID=UPI00077C301C|nr:hypothetical protein [Rossellomorea vietnamensis]